MHDPHKVSHSEGSRLRLLVLPGVWGAAAVTWKLACPLAQQPGLPTRIATSAVFFGVGTGLVLGLRRGLARELERMRTIARAAQRVVLRPVPPRLDGLALAAAQLSASRGAVVGGDLYEAVATPYGVRIVIGDVRGHGLAALGTVVALLGSFREAAHDEAELAGVLRRLERALGRHLCERAREEHPVAEEFVTLLLLEIGPDGEVRVLDCGHPGPYRIGGRRVEPVPVGDPLPPLGSFPLPADLVPYAAPRLLPGETLVLHTDGAEEARDHRGRFFPLPAVLADDVALLVVRNDRVRVPAQPAEPGLRRTRPTPSPHQMGQDRWGRRRPRCHGVSGRSAARTARGPGDRTVRGGAGGPVLALRRGSQVNPSRGDFDSVHGREERVLHSHPVRKRPLLV